MSVALRRPTCLLLFVFAALAIGARPAHAQTILWNVGAGFWDVSGNWLGGVVPGSTNDVVIDVAGVHTVTVRSTGGPFTVNSINMNGGDETLAITTGGSLTLLGAATVDNPTGASVVTNFSLAGTGATLAGPGNLTVTGTATLGTGGLMTGGGTTTLQGTTTISGSEFSLDAGRVLQNESHVTWSGFTTIRLDPDAANGGVGNIVNTLGAVWEATGNGVMVGSSSGDGTPTFDNAGTFLKSGGTGDTFIGAQFNNTGTLEVQTGTVRLAGGSAHTGATLLSSGTGTIEFSNGTHTLDAATTLTATNVEFTNTATTTIGGLYNVSGTTTLGGGHVVTFDAGADLQSLGTALVMSPGSFGALNLGAHDVSLVTLTSSGGTISGTGTVTVTGTATLNAGTMVGAGLTHFTASTTTALNGSYNLDDGRVLQNDGTVAGAGSINLNPNGNSGGVGTVLNTAGATWELTSSNGVFGSTTADGTPVFDNAGTFVKSGGSSSTVSASFVNTGLVDVQTGTLSLTGGSTHTGATITGNGTIQFGAGTHTLDAATSLTTENARFAGGATGTTTIDGLYDVGTSTTVVSGVADLSGANLQSLGTSLTVTGGTLDLGAHDVTVASLTHGGASATIAGTGTWTVTGDATLTPSSSGTRTTMTGAGTTILQGTTTAGPGSASTTIIVDGGRTLQNEGTLIWTGGNFSLNAVTTDGGVGTIVNAVGAVWDARVNNTISGSTTGGVPRFDNFGTFEKTAGGTGTTTVSTQFNNAGAVAVETGTLMLSGGGTHTGTFDIASGATLRLSTATATTHVLDAGTVFTGPGTLAIGPGVATSDTVVANTDITVAGTTNIIGNLTNLVLNGDWETGGLHYQGGTIEGPGDFTVTGAATIQGFSLDNMRMTGPGTTTLQGDTTMQGRINMAVDTGRALVNEGVLTWTSSTSTNVASDITVSGGSQLVNALGADMHLVSTGNNSVAILVDGTSSFDNFGTITSNGPGGFANSVSGAFNNAGTIIVESNRFAVTDLRGETGTVIVNGGTFFETTGSLSSETGTLRLEAGGTVIINSAGDVLTVHQDYDNANFGEGNSFNPLANISNVLVGQPGIAAAGDVAQTITGTAVVGGTTATPTLTIGNVRVGGTTFTYDVNNTGTDGPVLRGAIQDSVNGASITDARLSGSGVTAGNFSPIALGGSESFEVVFTANTVGLLDPMVGQAVHVINNFGNVTNQLMTIEVAAGAIAYRLAEAEVVPQPIVLGNARVGMASPEVTLSITNTAVDDGFSEKLNAAVGGTTSGVLATGSFNLLGPELTDNSSIVVSMDTSVAGSRNGTVTIDLASDGTGTSGLAPLALPSEVINVSGNVYRLAEGQVTTVVDLGDLRLGTGTATQALTVSNVALADGFSEDLDAAVTGATGDATWSGSVSLLAAGGASNAIEVGLDTSSVGALSGLVTIGFESNGSLTSGFLDNIAVGSENVQVTGTVYRLAEASVGVSTLPTFVRLGDDATAQVTVANIAPADGFSENLNAAFGATTGAISGTNGSITGLVPVDLDTVSLTVSLDTSSVGLQSGMATVLLTSDGTGINTLGQTALPSSDVSISSTVTQLANPVVQGTVDFGNVRAGTLQSQAITVTNDVPALDAPFTDLLNASFDAPASAGIAGLTGSITGLAGATADNSSMSIGLDTSAAGAINTTATVLLSSDGTAFGFGETGLTSQDVTVTGNVFRLAEAQVTPDPLVFNARVGDAGVMSALTIANIAVADGFSESLDVVDVQTLGAAFGTTGSVSGLIAAGGNDSGVAVTLDTTTAGVFNGTATVTVESNGLGTSNIVGNVALGTEDVALAANVYQAAVADVTTSVDLGFVRAGSLATGDITIANIAPVAALNDVLRETDRMVTGSGFGLSGAATDLAAGTDRTVTASLDTSAVGAYSATAAFDFASHNEAMSDLDLGTLTTTLTGTVTQLANPLVQASLNFGSVQQGSLQQMAITVTNDVLLSEQAFTDLLNASFDPTLAAGIASLTGSITGLAGGLSDNTSMVIQLDTSTAGAVNASATVLLVSDGTAFGFGLTDLESQTVQVLGSVEIEGSVFRLAEATINTPQPIDLGNVRVGDTSPTADLSITNSALADGFSESLNGEAGATTGGVLAGGSFSLLAAGATDTTGISVSMDTSTAGSRDGTATILFASDGTGTSGAGITALASQDVAVTGSVFRLAEGQVTPDPVVLNARVGDLGVNTGLTISNTAAADGFSESLEVTGVSVLGSEFGTSGAVAGLIAAGSSDSGLSVTLDTTTAGVFNGTLDVMLESNGLGTSNIAGNVDLGFESVALSANVFQTAIAQVTPTIDLGVIRVGDTVTTGTIDVANIAPTAALNDVLRESGRTVDPAFAVTGDVGDVSAGGVSNLTVSLMNSLSAGDYSGDIVLDLVSHNPLMSDVGAGSHTVQVSATVNNLALPMFEFVGGDGLLSSLGEDWFLLDFGTRTVGTGSVSLDAELGVRNAATGPADNLTGTFTLPLGSLFDFSGFTSFFGLSAGSLFGNLGVGIDLDLTGLSAQILTGQLFLNPVSVFPTLADLNLSPVRLDFRLNLVDGNGTVPEPAALVLLAVGLLGVATVARRRRGTPPATNQGR